MSNDDVVFSEQAATLPDPQPQRLQQPSHTTSLILMQSLVNAFNRWLLGPKDASEDETESDPQSAFLESCDYGLGPTPNPVFLEALSRCLQRGHRPLPRESTDAYGDNLKSDSDEDDEPRDDIPFAHPRPGLPYELVVIIFRYAGFHRPRSEDLIPFHDVNRNVFSGGPIAMEDIARSGPLTRRDLETICALQVGELANVLRLL